MSTFEASIEAFHHEASGRRGLDDFGEDDYRDALARLCRSLDVDAKLTPVGEFAHREMIVDALVARLLVEEGHRRHPEAAGSHIEGPLVIVGLPRTGTTVLQHLIAQDPEIQALEHWLQRTPKPRPPRETWDQDADFRAAADRVRMLYERSPEMRAIHEIEADLPDECWNLFSQNFAHSSWQANADVHAYAQWWSTCDMHPVYRRHRRNVELIGHREPARRWLFKDATHLFDLDALFAVYPDARIVQTHRDPIEVIASVCSLCWSSRRAMNVGTDIREFARSTLELWQRSISNMLAARSRQAPERFFDLDFERFVTDPVAAIRDLYRHFGIDYSNAADAAIERFRRGNPIGKHGTHRYTLEEWGLDAAEIAERFSTYTSAFGLSRD